MYQFGISSGAAVGGTTGIHGFHTAVASLRMKGVRDFIEHHLDITSAALHAEADYLPVTSCAAQLSLPTGLSRNEPAVHQPLTPYDTAIRRQGITNLTCRDSSQWLTANQAFIFDKVSDAAFKTCYHLHHMFPVLGSRKF
jgi:hypothetical protein